MLIISPFRFRFDTAMPSFSSLLFRMMMLMLYAAYFCFAAIILRHIDFSA